MEKIDRYEIDSTPDGGTAYSESSDGYWVKYKDHERIVKEIEKKAFEKGRKKGYGEGYKQAIVNF